MAPHRQLPENFKTLPSKMTMMMWAMNGDDDDGDGDLVVVPLPKNFMSPPSIMSQKHRGMQKSTDKKMR